VPSLRAGPNLPIRTSGRVCGIGFLTFHGMVGVAVAEPRRVDLLPVAYRNPLLLGRARHPL